MGRLQGKKEDVPGISLNGRKMVSSRSGASSLCGVSGLHGSTMINQWQSQSQNEPGASRAGPKYNNHAPSPSIIARRSASIQKSPRALTAVIFGKAGTEKCFPGGKAYGRIVKTTTNDKALEKVITCLQILDS